MYRMNHYASLLFLLMVLTRTVQCLPDPIINGSKYLMSASITGDGYYLGCGDDYQCSILPISGAEEHDGWTIHVVDSTFRLHIRDDLWALAVQSNGVAIFGDTVLTDSNAGEIWNLWGWPDGTYQLYNGFWNKSLDVENVTLFMNSDANVNLMGQHWYFRSVEPQVTVTSTITSTYTVNNEANSTTTVTVTTCLGKVGLENH
jgi:hypothetical protein